jgi:hypothetical protein
MENCELEIQDNILILRVDLAKECGFTGAAKSVRIGSTAGNLQLWVDGKPHPDKIRVNLNVFRPLKPDEHKAADEYRRESIY